MGLIRRRLLIREKASEGGGFPDIGDKTILANSSEITSNASICKDICNWVNGKETVLLY